MSLVPTSLPEVILDDQFSPPKVSRWNAAHNPYVFEFTRKDSIVLAVANSSGRVQLTLSANFLSGLQVGDTIYVNTEKYKGLYQVFLLPVGVVVIIDTPFVEASAGGYINYPELRPNYYVEIKIKQPNLTTLATLRYTPLIDGKARVDVSGAVQSYLSNLDKAIINGVDEPAPTQQQPDGISFPFKISYREYWKNSGSQSETNLNDFYYAVNGAFQIGHPNNGNYADFVVLNDDEKPKIFLSPFNVPVAYTNYLDLNLAYFIWDVDALGGDDIDLARFTVYGNAPNVEVPANTTTDLIQLTQNGNTINKINAVRFGLGGVSGVDNRAFVYIWLQRRSDNQPITLKKKFRIRRLNEQDCNTIMLRWLAPDGSWANYLFEGNYRESLQVDAFSTFRQAFDNISELETFETVLKKRGFNKFQVGMTGLSANDAAGIKTLLYSPQVYQIVSAGDFGFRRIGVIVEPGTFSIRPVANKLFDIEFSVVFSEIFNQNA